MAKLTPVQEKEVWVEWMDQNKESCNVDKHELRAFLDAVNTWLEDEQGNLNLAIPLPARASLSSKQKAQGLLVIVKKRFNIL